MHTERRIYHTISKLPKQTNSKLINSEQRAFYEFQSSLSSSYIYKIFQRQNIQNDI